METTNGAENMSNTADSLLSNVNGLRDTLERLVELANGNDAETTDYEWLIEQGADLPSLEGEDDDYIEHCQGDVNEAARQLLDEMPLSIEVLGKRSLGDDEWEVTHLEVTFCTGGPHIELDTGRGQIVGYWGGDTTYRGVRSDVVAYFDGLADL